MSITIEKVKNNQEKYENYREQSIRFKKANKEGFYLEALMIIYSMIEDRLSSFLFYAGVTNKLKTGITSNKNVKPFLRSIMQVENNKGLKYKNISAKILLIKKLLEFQEGFDTNQNRLNKHTNYPELLQAEINKIKNIEEFKTTLLKLVRWKEERNTIVHGLMNKNYSSFSDQIKFIVEDGKSIYDVLNKVTKNMESKNKIRNKLNIQ